MTYTGHAEFENHIGSGLGMVNALIDMIGNGTSWASATTLATWQAVNDTKEGLASIHETDKAIFQSANRYGASLNALGIYSNTDIAASNDTATTEARFTAQDGNFPATYHGSRARGC